MAKLGVSGQATDNGNSVQISRHDFLLFPAPGRVIENAVNTNRTHSRPTAPIAGGRRQVTPGRPEALAWALNGRAPLADLAPQRGASVCRPVVSRACGYDQPMAGRALVVGGTGLAGRAIAVALAEAGWETTAASRGRLPVPDVLTRAGVRIVELDTGLPRELATALRSGVDLLVQAAAYTAQDAAEILRASDTIGGAIVLSTMSVYVDDLRRFLDESTGAATDPRPPVPIPETQRTLPPSAQTYSTRKVAMEQRLLGQDTLPVTATATPTSGMAFCGLFGHSSG